MGIWVVVVTLAIIFVALVAIVSMTLRICRRHPQALRESLLRTIYALLNCGPLIDCFQLGCYIVFLSDPNNIVALMYQICYTLNLFIYQSLMFVLVIRIAHLLLKLETLLCFLNLLIVFCWSALVSEGMLYLTAGICCIATDAEWTNTTLSIAFIISDISICVALVLIFISCVAVWKLKLKMLIWCNQKLFSALLLALIVIQVVALYTDSYLDAMESTLTQSIQILCQVPGYCLIVALLIEAQQGNGFTGRLRSHSSLTHTSPHVNQSTKPSVLPDFTRPPLLLKQVLSST